MLMEDPSTYSEASRRNMKGRSLPHRISYSYDQVGLNSQAVSVPCRSVPCNTKATKGTEGTEGTEELSSRFSSCNLVCELSNFQTHYVYFTETCRNVIVHGTFTKIQYSDSMISFHGIYLYFSLKLDPKSERKIRVVPRDSGGSLSIFRSNAEEYVQGTEKGTEKVTEKQKWSEDMQQPSYAMNRYQICYLPTCPVNYNVIKELNQVEYNIMEHYKQFKGNIHKQNVYSLRNQLRTGNIRVYGNGQGTSTSTVILKEPTTYSNQHTYFVLKISGIWETSTHVGITYKFMDIGTPIVMQS